MSRESFCAQIGPLEDVEWKALWRKVVLPDRIEVPLSCPKKKVIFLSGPTGVGKTELSLLLAESLGGEIVSADSMQVYKGMDIGTAKASLEQRSRVPHHLIDVREIDQSFNVMDFFTEAMQAVDSIIARGRVPIVVGGTGFYVNALLYGPPGGPPSVDVVRAQWEAQWDRYGGEALFSYLETCDPEYASTITSNDKQKIIRALEILSLTKKKISDIPRKTQGLHMQDVRCWFLHMPKEELYPKIEMRCQEMLSAGLLAEVEFLDHQGIRANSSASGAIGYRQALEYRDSSCTQADWEVFVRAFYQASRRYAKRQITWFKKEPLFRWISRSAYDLTKIAEIILQDFDNPPNTQ